MPLYIFFVFFWGAVSPTPTNIWCYHVKTDCSYELFLDSSSEVTEKEACHLVQAFWEEFEPLLKPDSIVPSGNFCALASRLARTDHENRLSSHLPKFGLCTNIPVSFVDVGLSETHPILAVSDFIKTLDADNKMDTLLMGSRAQQYEEFWNYWRQLEPGHPIFHVHHDHLGRCIPVAIHADEGTSVKKKP